MDNSGGGGIVSTVTVPLTDWLLCVAVTVYEPEASAPKGQRRTGPVRRYQLWRLWDSADAVPLSGLTLNVTVSPCAGLPSS